MPAWPLEGVGRHGYRRGPRPVIGLCPWRGRARGLQYTSHYTQPFMGKRRRELLDAKSGVYRFDHLLVLRKTEAPAVLLEAGSIVNRDEELELGSREHYAIIGTAIVQAVEAFCSSRSS